MNLTKYFNHSWSVGLAAHMSYIILFCLLSHQASATHVVGGNLYYECLGNDQYRIVLEFRRDCFNGAVDAQFDDPASIGVFDGNGNLMTSLGVGGELLIPFTASDTLNEILTSECKVVGQDVCVHRTSYIDTITLPANDTGYILAYQRCCRTGTLTNVVEPLETGATHWVEITPLAIRTCNSSAVFNDWPDIFLCANEALVFDHSASDADGDSLVYRLCAPSLGGTIDDPKPTPPNPPPFGTVTYASPYSVADMMGGVPLTIDPNTGILTGTPNIVGQFLIGICVEEYRNGNLISTTRRDFEYNVRICSFSPISAFDVEPNPSCESLSVQFNNSSTGETYEWFFDWPDMTVGSTDENPSFTYPAAGSYDVALVTTEGICTDTLIQEVGVSVLGDPTADFSLRVDACTSDFELILEDQSNTGQTITNWDWTLNFDGNVTNLTGANPMVSLTGNDGPVDISLLVTTESGCTSLVTESFDLQAVNFELAADTLTICRGESIGLVSIADPNASYFWTPAHSLDLTDPAAPIATPVGNTTYQVVVSAGACQYTEMITVLIEEPLDFSIQVDSTTLCDDQMRLFIEGFPDEEYIWFFDGELMNIVNTGNEFFVPASASGQTILAAPSSGACQDPESFLIQTGQFVVNIGNAINEQYCTGEGIQILLQPNNPNFEYTFDIVSDLPILANNDNGNITLFASTPGLQSFSYRVTSDIGCEFFDQFTFVVDDRVAIDLPEELLVCPSDDVVELNTGGNPSYSYTWSSSPDGLISDPNAVSPMLTVVDGATVSVDIEVPDNELCSNTQDLVVRVLDEYSVSVRNLANAYCQDGDISLVASANIDFVEFEWIDIDGSQLSDQSMYSFEALLHDSLLLIGTSEFGCMDTLLVEVNYFESPDLETNIDDTTLCQNSTTEIRLLDESFTSVEWMDDMGTVIGTGTSLSYEVIGDISLQVTVVDDQGCTWSRRVDLETFEPIEIEVNADFDQFCVGQESLLTVILPRDTVEYAWFDQSGALIANGVSTEAVIAANSVFIVTATDRNGCVFSREVQVETFVNERISTNADSETFCPGTDTEIFVLNPESSTDYRWFDIDDNLISVTPSFTYDVFGDTEIRLSILDDNGCQFFDTIQIRTFELDSIRLNTDFMQFCNNSQVEIEVLDPNDDSRYLWYSADGSLLTEANSLTTTVDTSTVLFVESISADGCSFRRLVDLMLYPPINIELSIDENTQFCTSGPIQIEVINQQDGVSYGWFDADNQLITPGAVLATEISEDTSFIIRGIDQNGCQASRDVFVRVFPEVNIDLVGLESFYCFGDEISLSYETDAEGTLVSQWLDEDGEILSSFDALTLVADSSQVIRLQVTDENGCVYTTPIDIDVDQEIEFDFDVSLMDGQLFYCSDSTLILSVNGGNNLSYEWRNQSGNLVGGGQTIQYQPVGNDTLTVTASTERECSSEMQLILTPFELMAEISGERMLCLGDATRLQLENIDSMDDLSFVWSPIGAIDGPIDQSSIDISPTQTTDYQVVISNAAGCVWTELVTVIVNEFPEVLEVFTSSPIVAVGNSVTLSTNLDPSLYDFEWSPADDLDDPFSDSPEASPSASGQIEYTVIVTDDNGCTTTGTVVLDVRDGNCDESDVFVPNMFTPNGDSSNEVFRPVSNLISSMTMIIYDRWGEKIYESDDINAAWDGTFQGESLNPDVYGYHLRVECINGLEYEKQGNVTLMR